MNPRLLTVALALACLALSTAADAARTGTKRDPTVVPLNPAEPVDNWQGATFNPDAPPLREGRNRLHVQLPAHPFPYATVLFIKRCEDQEYRFACVDLERSDPPLRAVITGLGRGPYHVAAILGGGAGVPERHFTWGPAVIRFPTRARSQRYVQLTFTEPTP